MKNQHLNKLIAPVVLALLMVVLPAVASHYTNAHGTGGSFEAQMGLPIDAISTAARAQFTTNDPVALDPSLTGFDTSRFGPKKDGEGDGNDNIFVSVATLVLIAGFSLGSYKHQRNKRLQQTSDSGEKRDE